MSIFGLPYRVALQIAVAKIGNYCLAGKRLGQMGKNRAGNEEGGSPSHLIFLMAYDKLGAKAFEYHLADYLAKTYQPLFSIALAKAEITSSTFSIRSSTPPQSSVKGTPNCSSSRL